MTQQLHRDERGRFTRRPAHRLPSVRQAIQVTATGVTLALGAAASDGDGMRAVAAIAACIVVIVAIWSDMW